MCKRFHVLWKWLNYLVGTVSFDWLGPWLLTPLGTALVVHTEERGEEGWVEREEGRGGERKREGRGGVER